jgi:CRISPR/Cas system CSM-associated protein Csm2 small subunit
MADKDQKPILRNREKFEDLEKKETEVKKRKRNYQDYLFGKKQESSKKPPTQKKIERTPFYSPKPKTKQEDKPDESPEDQIELALKHSKKEIYYSAKRKIRRFEKIVEIIPYWKNLLTVFTTVLGIGAPVFMWTMVYFNYDLIQDKMPVIFNHTNEIWNESDKSIFLAVPGIILLFNILLIRLMLIIYNFDKKLVIAMSFALLLINILATINYVQLIFL